MANEDDTKPTSTTNEGDKDSMPPTESTKDEAAKQTLKDLINVTNEWVEITGEETGAEGGGVGGGGDDGRDGDGDAIHSLQKAVGDTLVSVRGGIDAHVAPKVQEFVEKTAQLHEQHIAPHIEKAGRALQDVGANTKAAIDMHVAPHIEKVKASSLRAMTDVQTHSVRAMDGVKEHTTKAVEGAKFHSSRAIESVQTGTKVVVDTHIAPKVDEFVKHSSRALDETGKKVSSCWGQTSHFVVSNRPYYWGTAPGLTHPDDAPWYLILEEATCRAFGRVVFCNNPVTGIFIWLGILLASPLAGVCSLLSVLMVNLTALYLDMDRPTLQAGLYAYNAVLVGTALVDYFTFDFKVSGLSDGWPVVIFFSLFLGPTTLIAGLYIQHKLLGGITYPFLLLPFNMVMFVVLLSAKLWDSTMITQVELVDEGVLDDVGSTEAIRFFGYQALFNGVSRIFLVDGIASGVLILIGTFTCSRILCLALVAGAFLSSLLSLAVFEEHTAFLNAGFAGFSPALTVAGIFYYLVPSWKLTGLAFFWMILTMILQAAVAVLLDALSIPVAMTWGYVFALMPLLSINLDTVFGKGSFIRRIPFLELSTPEEYLASIAASPDGEDIKEAKTAETMEGAEYVGDLEEAVFSLPDGGAAANEETPLLAKESL